MIDEILETLKAIANSLSVFKRDPRINEERAEKLDIRNKVRNKKAQLKKLKLERKIRRRQKKL